MTQKKRAAISVKLRFEVFKRDKFMCQYCGATPAQKLLHCDHIVPVVEGGKTELLNLRTACADCNLGKGARLLSDDAVVTAQHRQLIELEERRQQLEMMRQWREELEAHKISEVDIVADAIGTRAPKWQPSESGRNELRRWIKKSGLVEVLNAADESFDMFFKDVASVDDWRTAFSKIAMVLRMREQAKEDPNLPKILYVQGILRNRFDQPRESFVDNLKDAAAKGYPLDVLESVAKRATSWSDYVTLLNAWSKAKANAKAAPAATQEEADEPEDPEIIESYAALDDPWWHIEMWSTAFGETGAARFLRAMSEWTERGGYFREGKITWDDVCKLRGAHAVGLLQPVSRNGEVFRLDERGNIYPDCHIIPWSPREATNAFGRLGGLRLGFWRNPRAFARVDQVH